MNSKAKITNLKKFIKGEGYFLEKFLGKKPVPGLFTEKELLTAQSYWSAKQTQLRNRFKTIPLTYANVGPAGISEWVAGFNFAKPAVITNIGNSVQQRIPMLLMSSSKKKGKSIQAVAKGSSLEDKLKVIEGGDSVRTIAKCLWSPLMEGCTQGEFVQLVMQQAAHNIFKEPQELGFLEELLTRPNLAAEKSVLYERLLPDVQNASSVYVEIIDDKRGLSAWDLAFPPRPIRR